ncbi:MAG: hypothetical protein J7K68_00295 [Candidatus Diapherotrites archaeon]|nr:hypothetical protein [Candidatus Diapherotrites archaeon]
MGKKTIIFDVVYLGQCGCGYGRKITRKIEVKESQTLDDLHDAIINKSFKWTDIHLYSFFMDGKAWSDNRDMEYTRLVPEENLEYDSRTADVCIRELNLRQRQKFFYIYDFGDDHQFRIKVAGFGKVQKGKEYPLILEEEGEAPEQYPPPGE